MHHKFRPDGLEKNWYWVREDIKHWSLTECPNWLRIITQYGSIYKQEKNNQPNILLTRSHDNLFEISTHMKFIPHCNFHAAGLIAYQDDDNYVLMERAFSSFAVGDGLFLDLEWKGEVRSLCRGISGSSVKLKLISTKQDVIGYYGIKKNEWIEVGRMKNPGLNFNGVGLFATNGGMNPNAPEIPADFEFFEYKQL